MTRSTSAFLAHCTQGSACSPHLPQRLCL
jgi:hypothetical protein